MIADRDRLKLLARARRAYRDWRVGVGLVLGLGFSGLVVIAIGVVLYLGVWTGYRNTRDLTESNTALVLTVVEERLREALEPVRNQLLYLGTQIERRALDPLGDPQFGPVVAAALAGTPQVTGIGFVGRNMDIVRTDRFEDGRIEVVRGERAEGDLRAVIEESLGRTDLHWGDVVWIEAIRQPVLGLRLPVRRDGETIGLLYAVVTVARLSQVLGALSEELGVTPFILVGRDRVLAHPNLAYGFGERTADRPLPALDEVGDSFLAQLWTPHRDDTALRRQLTLPNAQARIRREDDVTVIYAWRTISRYSDSPWVVGTILREQTLDEAMERIGRAAAAGGAVLLLALFLSWRFSRLLTLRMRDFAGAASAARALELGAEPSLGRSRLRELDETAQAFNAMTEALRWFAAYVPRILVRRLLDYGDGALESRQQMMTVMFTDLAGFTSLSESMNAAEVAGFLNEHFALVDTAIEAEGGTVDKHLGDGVMAFWGAPEPQADHAMRACRAALAIAAAIAADNARRQAAGLPWTRCRIGIQSGPVTVGNIGGGSRISYTIVGDPVNTAARLNEMAKELAFRERHVVTLIGGETAAELHGAFHLRDLGSRVMRGRREDTEVFELLADPPARAAAA